MNDNIKSVHQEYWDDAPDFLEQISLREFGVIGACNHRPTKYYGKIVGAKDDSDNFVPAGALYQAYQLGIHIHIIVEFDNTYRKTYCLNELLEGIELKPYSEVKVQ